MGTILGFFAGAATIALSAILAAGSGKAAVLALWNPSSAFIALGGCAASTIAAFGLKGVFSGLSAAGRALVKRPDPLHGIDAISMLADLGWNLGPAVAEDMLNEASDPFLRAGLEQAAFGGDEKELESFLATQMKAVEQLRGNQRAVWEFAANAADSWGAIGAFLGFAAALFFMDDPVLLKACLFSALASALYGLAASNLLMKPMARKLDIIDSFEAFRKECVCEALISVLAGESPEFAIKRLRNLITHSTDFF
ncbi:MAG: MotA/TolQ/ExbB proton channel family protein [Clostridiales bacterium]|jgi:chemotaxis protein MotA|nr:MotA/TolQ/ExbB proton channel family protein [Clostridiales bacterium]